MRTRRRAVSKERAPVIQNQNTDEQSPNDGKRRSRSRKRGEIDQEEEVRLEPDEEHVVINRFPHRDSLVIWGSQRAEIREGSSVVRWEPPPPNVYADVNNEFNGGGARGSGDERIPEANNRPHSMIVHILAGLLSLASLVVVYLIIFFVGSGVLASIKQYIADKLQLLSDLYLSLKRGDNGYQCSYGGSAIGMMECEIFTSFNRLLFLAITQVYEFIQLIFKSNNVIHIFAVLNGLWSAARWSLGKSLPAIGHVLVFLLHSCTSYYECCCDVIGRRLAK